jgi:hypothetical protein
VGILLDFPVYFSAILFVALWISLLTGMSIRKIRPIEAGEWEDFGLIVTATLTLLASPYHWIYLFNSHCPVRSAQKLRGAGASAIGTEYVRADLLPRPRCGESSRAAQQLSLATHFVLSN